MTEPQESPRAAMYQALEAALGACGSVFPAKGTIAEQPRAAFEPSPKLAEALQFAIEKHGGQTRKGTTIPFVTHLLAVASLVGESGGTEAEMMAALLHDAVEDGGGAPVLVEIRQRFGEEVAAIVDGCTDDDSGLEKAPWLHRKQDYLEHMVEAPLSVLRVACADKLHNASAIARDLRDHGPSVFQRFRGDREGTLWYYRSMARIFGALVQDEPSLDPGFRSMIRDLRETVAGLEG
ncbi:MAG: HD domain-containing protein [Holophaga sp.]|nr:HD domain-containing protein [Holophaga sp.]